MYIELTIKRYLFSISEHYLSCVLVLFFFLHQVHCESRML